MKKKIAIVTGASAGMGRDFVKELQKEKNVDEIWMIARRKERLDAMAAKSNGRLRAFALDLTDMSSFNCFEELLTKEKPQIQRLYQSVSLRFFI